MRGGVARLLLIGLSGWGDHDSVYPPGTAARDKLRAYAEHYSFVEVDSSFYALPAPELAARWCAATPDGFRFLVKAYQGMTGHQRGESYYESAAEAYAAFHGCLRPFHDAGKLWAALFQYPPWFDCSADNVRLLRETKRRMDGFPCALEFRHQSWYAPEFRERTLDFAREEGWIHTVCDEPQAGIGSIPIVAEATRPDRTLIRLHGRNVAGWSQSSAPNWREIRYLYDYNDAELREWKERIERLRGQSESVGIIFNNNSGGHAAGNADRLRGMLGLPVPPVAGQLDLFDL